MGRGGTGNQAVGQKNLLHGPRSLPAGRSTVARRAESKDRFTLASAMTGAARSHEDFDQRLLEALENVATRKELTELLGQAHTKLEADQAGVNTLLLGLGLPPSDAVNEYVKRSLAALSKGAEAIRKKEGSPERTILDVQAAREETLAPAIGRLRTSLNLFMTSSLVGRMLGGEVKAETEAGLEAKSKGWDAIAREPGDLIQDLRARLIANPAGADEFVRAELIERCKRFSG